MQCFSSDELTTPRINYGREKYATEILIKQNIVGIIIGPVKGNIKGYMGSGDFLMLVICLNCILMSFGIS